jgi:PAS domain S-box-containing protein
MIRSSSKHATITSSAGFFARLLFVVFTMEMAVSVIFSRLLAKLNPVLASITDGIIVVLLGAPFIWFLIIRPLSCVKTVGGEIRTNNPAALFGKVLAVVFLVESLVNLIILFVLPHANFVNSYFADACLTTLICAPLLWRVLSLEQRSHIDSLDDLLGTPLKLYVTLLSTVFLIDLLELPFIELFSVPENQIAQKFVDAFLTTLIVAPIFWWLVVRPLRKAATSEKSYSDAMLSQVVEAIVSIDSQGAIQKFNPAAEKIFGYSAAEITGKPVTILFSDEGPGLDELVRPEAAIEKGKYTGLIYEIVGRRRDGSKLNLDFSHNRVLVEGEQQFLILVMRDISERKQAEHAQQESLSLFAATLESTADGILVIDSDRHVRIFNKKFLDMWRVPRQTAESANSSQLIDLVKGQLEDPEAYLARVEELDGQPDVSALDVIRFKDGRVYNRYSQPQILDGKVVGRVLSYRDITDKTKAEEALKMSEERYAIAISGSNDGLWDWDIKNGTIFYSSRLKQMLGYSDSEFSDTTGAIKPLIHPEDYDGVREAILAHLNKRNSYVIECRLRNKDGTYRWYRTHGQAVWDEAGTPVRMAGYLSDITTRKETEQALRESELRFRQIFEESEDAIIFFKPGTCAFIDVNRTAEKLFGFSKAELKSQGLASFCHSEDIARFTNDICNMRDRGITHLNNMVSRRKDGTEIIISVHAKLIKLSGIDVVFCTLRDITSRVRLEEESRNIQAKLIQANKMTSLGLLVSGVAHEINNPNNFIMANSQLLSRVWQDALKVLREYYQEHGDFQIGGISFSVLNEDASHLITSIIDGSIRINDIVISLKNFARQDHLLVGQEVDVNRIITTAVTILHHHLVKHTEKFHLDLDESIPRVKGSGQQLEQVVMNLLMNACQALTDKGQGIWLSTGFDEPAGQVMIIVRDEGVGIPKNIHERVLDPFFTTKLDCGGTGLGLSISHSIIKEHGGLLEFTSVPGQGTTFIVKIPAAEPAEQEKC